MITDSPHELNLDLVSGRCGQPGCTDGECASPAIDVTTAQVAAFVRYLSEHLAHEVDPSRAAEYAAARAEATAQFGPGFLDAFVALVVELEDPNVWLAADADEDRAGDLLPRLLTRMPAPAPVGTDLIIRADHGRVVTVRVTQTPADPGGFYIGVTPSGQNHEFDADSIRTRDEIATCRGCGCDYDHRDGAGACPCES